MALNTGKEYVQGVTGKEFKEEESVYSESEEEKEESNVEEHKQSLISVMEEENETEQAEDIPVMTTRVVQEPVEEGPAPRRKMQKEKGISCKQFCIGFMATLFVTIYIYIYKYFA